ncbi:MAG: threonylcarbamoyl-AMP synthase [Clostridia bacterium]|nr:threonylcarbamoyl-AMP synthase [Clostridia bacterium]
MEILYENKDNIEKITYAIQNGQVCIFMTDTIYGLHCDAENNQAIEMLYKIKKRDKSKSFILLIPENYSLDNLVSNLSNKAKRIIEKIWPNPITLIFDLKEDNSLGHALKERGTIAIRMPKDNLCQNILQKLNKPIVSTSVNLSGEKNLLTAEEIESSFNEGISYLLKSQHEDRISKPSTIIDLTKENVNILREGEITKDEIEKIIDEKL